MIGKGWVAAGDLVEGDEVYNLDGTTSTILGSEIEVLDEPMLVYNLEVEDLHSYFVGCVPVLVHNICTIVDENGVKIISKYPDDHGNPAHLHVIGGGHEVKIGPMGLPLKSSKKLTDKQRQVVQSNLPAIKKSIKEAQKQLRKLPRPGWKK